jgi:hypothetical protein
MYTKHYSPSYIVGALLSVVPLSSMAVESGWSGIVEIETGALVNQSEISESDIVLATVELGYEHYLSKNLSAAFVLLHEDDDTEPAEIDQATLRIRDVAGFDINMGRQYLPFGSYNSAMISDPLTLEIGETREAAIGVSKYIGLVTAEAFLFQGDVQTENNAWIPDYMAKASIANEGDFSYSIEAYYISELANSENITAAITTPDGLSHNVGGTGAAVGLAYGALSVGAECLTAIKKYAAQDLGSAQPMACHAETSASMSLAGKEGAIALGYGVTNDGLVLGLPKSRISATASILLTKYSILSVEWAMDSDYGVADGGSGQTSHVLTAQMALEF